MFVLFLTSHVYIRIAIISGEYYNKKRDLTSHVYISIAIAKLHKTNMRILCILFQSAMPNYLIECICDLILRILSRF